MRDTNYINSYLQNMLTSNVPEATKSMILNLNDYGKRAIVNYHDPSSDFHKHADIEKIFINFQIVRKTIHHYFITPPLVP